MNKITTKFITPSQLPFVIEPVNQDMSFSDLLHFMEENNDFFQKNLLKFGALLFRDFPINGAQDFAKVIHALKLGKMIDYIGGDSPRKKIVEGVYTSTEAPPSMKLPLHNELSYVKTYPRHIYFYCDIAPLTKGETILGDARKIYRAIDPEVQERFIKKGLRYVSCYPYKKGLMQTINKKHKSWIHVFETEDKNEVAKKCEENEIFFKWAQNDWLEISQIRPSILSHPQTGESVWFNQAHHFDFNPKFLGWGRYLGAKILYCRIHTLLHNVFFADNTKIPRRDLYHILDVLDEQTIAFPWQKNDLLVLDNILIMHGRAAFKGPRRVLTAMTS